MRLRLISSSALQHSDALGELGQHGWRIWLKQPRIATDAFDEDGAREHRDTVAPVTRDGRQTRGQSESFGSAITAISTEAGTRFTKQAQPPYWNRVVRSEVENHLRATEPARNDWRYDLQVMSLIATAPKTLI